MTSYSEENDRWLTFGLAFVGGYGDAAGLVLAYTFTGHVTGNLVLVAIAVATRNGHAVLRHLLAIGTFLGGILLSALIDLFLRKRLRLPLLPAVMVLEIALVGLAALAMTLQWEYGTGAFILCVALALGLQNGALRRVVGTSVHTTYLTGMITNLIISAANKGLGDVAQERPITADPTLRLLSGIWMSFLLGAVTGAAMVLRFKGVGILGAAAVLATLVLVTIARRR